MNAAAVSPATTGAEDDQSSAPKAALETPNDSGVQREGAGSPVPNLCPETRASVAVPSDTGRSTGRDERGRFATGTRPR